MGPLDIKTIRRNIHDNIPKGTKVAGIRRILQWNGNTRHDFWTPPDNLDAIITYMSEKQQDWIIKQFETFQVRQARRSPLRQPPRKIRPESFSIITLNTQGTGSKYYEITEYIERMAPDFALLQETKQSSERSSLISANYDSIGIAEALHTDSARGMAILFQRGKYEVSKLEVEKDAEHWLLPILAKNSQDGSSHLIVGLYLNSNQIIRNHHIPILVRTVDKLRKEHGDTPFILAGDWNMKTHEVDSFINTFHHLGLERQGDWLPSDHTWQRREGGTVTARTLIDHILTEPREVPPQITIDYTYGRSDHHPVIASWPLPSHNTSSTPSERMNHKLLLAKADEIRRTNYFTPLLDLPDTDDPELLAEEFSKACWSAARETGCTRMAVAGRKKRKKMRISRRSKRLVRARSRAVEDWNLDPSQDKLDMVNTLIKETKKSLKEDAKTRAINFQLKLGDAIASGEASDEAWRTINSCIGRTSTKIPIRALENIKTGEIATTEETIGQALFEHYNHLFSDTENINDIDYSDIPLKIEESELPGINEPIEWPELRSCIVKLGRNKSPGPDGVVSELYITATRTEDPDLRTKVKTEPICDLGRLLLKLAQLIWSTGKFPRCWDAATIISLPKKPGSTKTGDYRGISLIPTISKLITSIIATRILKGALETGRLCKEQAGFRSYEEAVAQATLVYELTQRARERRETTYITFIDAEKAFDRAPHGAIMAKAHAFGVRGRILDLIKNLYQNASFTVRNGDWTSEPGRVEKGVKQGDPLSPILFSIFMNDLNIALQKDAPSIGHSLYPGGPQITTGKFADDVAMIAPNRETAIHQQLAASAWMDKCKMRANAAKCAVMIIEPWYEGYELLDRNPDDWKLQGQSIPIKNEYTYLGIHLNSTLDLHRIAELRISKAKNIKNMCLKFFWSRKIPLHLKVVILKHVIIPVMTYGCEVWGWSPTASTEADKLITECIRNIITGSNSSDSALLRHSLDILSTHNMAIKKSIRLFKKSSKSKTHFHDITLGIEPSILSWGSRTIEEIIKLHLPTDLPPALESIHNCEHLDIEDDRYMTYVHHQLHRRAAYQEISTRKNEKDSIKRFREGRSMNWNHLYLDLWKLHPTISKGFTVLLKIRITDFRGTYRLAREGLCPEIYRNSWSHTCPFCRMTNHPEYAEHIITVCSFWSSFRQKIFDNTTLLEWSDIAKTIKVLGQPIDQSLSRIIPNIEQQPLEGIELLKRTIKSAYDNVTEDELKDWITKIATFLQDIHYKRRKLLLQWENQAAEPQDLLPTRNLRQLRITDLWAPANTGT